MIWKAPNLSKDRMTPCIYDGLNRGPQVGYDYEPNGEVIWYSKHEDAMYEMQKRITFLENCCDEYMRHLTGD